MSTQAKTQKKDVYGIITEKIIEQLEKGTAPWQKPWTGAGIPTNLVSNRPYRGINVMLLSMFGYEQNLFLTSKQLKELGGSIKPEEKPHLVVYWNYQNNNEKDDDEDKEGTIETTAKRNALLRYYTVFNIAQCEGIPKEHIPTMDREITTNASCKLAVSNMPNKPRIQHKEQEAYYNPLKDFINMPRQSSFTNDDAYYATLFHELVHSTGHMTRLNRKDLIQMSEFGIEQYSHEELVAEIGSCYLQSYVGITEQFEQSTAYIRGWLNVLQSNTRFIFSASTAAQKAVDYILGRQNDTNEE